MLEIKNLSVNYITDKANICVLDKLSLALPEGSVLGISGTSGMGKTTLLRAILGLLPNNAHCDGVIVYNDVSYSLNNEKADGLLKDLLFVPQHTLDSVSQVHKIGSMYLDIALSKGLEHNKKILKARFEAIAEQLAINTKLWDVYPFQLSGGMLQRVLLTIGLSIGSKIIVLDEPTSALDAENQDIIISTLKTINSKFSTTIIIVSHEEDVINSLASYRLTLLKGRYNFEKVN